MAQSMKSCFLIVVVLSICTYVLELHAPIVKIGPSLWRRIISSKTNLRIKPKFDKVYSSHGNSSKRSQTGKSSLATNTPERLQKTTSTNNSNIYRPTQLSVEKPNKSLQKTTSTNNSNIYRPTQLSVEKPNKSLQKTTSTNNSNIYRPTQLSVEKPNKSLQKTRSTNNSNIYRPTQLSVENANKSYILRQCKPKQTIVFVKTHKTGSTTLSRIIDIYGYEHSLSFVRRLEWEKYFHLSNHKFTNKSYEMFIPPLGVPPGNYERYKYNILTLHVRYTREIFDNFMHPDAMYISILREPSKQFESAFNFFDIARYVPGSYTRRMAEFLRKPKLYKDRVNLDKRPYVQNNQIFDFGLEERSFNDAELIKKTIIQLDRDMDLVLINEYYDESLVLLSKVLCWDLQDMVYLATNQRSKQMKTNVGRALSHKIRQWNSADCKLYDHFLKRLKERIVEYGPTFADDLATFKSLRTNFSKECNAVRKKRGKRPTLNLTVNAQSRCEYFLESPNEINKRLEISMGIVIRS